jgi:hypothetical protein
MCEFTSYVELYTLPDRTAESVADCLIGFSLRWDTPSCIWSGHDAEIKNEVVHRVCAYLGIRQMWTSPRYSDGAARQERKHLQINQVLKLLVKGKLREWDDYLPIVKWRLRNTNVQHLGYTPRQMVFGRATQQLSPSHLSLGDFRKHHSRAKELTLGNRGQAKRRVHARTHARKHVHPPPPPTESAPKTFLPLLSPQTTAFFTSVLSISGFVRGHCQNSRATCNP